MDFIKDMKKDSQPGNSVEAGADNMANQGRVPILLPLKSWALPSELAIY